MLERAGFSGDMGRGLEYLFEVVEANALEAGIAALQIQLASIIIPAGICPTISVLFLLTNLTFQVWETQRITFCPC